MHLRTVVIDRHPVWSMILLSEAPAIAVEVGTEVKEKLDRGDNHTHSRLRRLPQRAQIDAQRLALLVEVAALQAQRFRRVGHSLVMAAELRQNLFAFETIRAL